MAWAVLLLSPVSNMTLNPNFWRAFTATGASGFNVSQITSNPTIRPVERGERRDDGEEEGGKYFHGRALDIYTVSMHVVSGVYTCVCWGEGGRRGSAVKPHETLTVHAGEASYSPSMATITTVCPCSSNPCMSFSISHNIS